MRRGKLVRCHLICTILHNRYGRTAASARTDRLWVIQQIPRYPSTVHSSQKKRRRRSFRLPSVVGVEYRAFSLASSADPFLLLLYLLWREFVLFIPWDVPQEEEEEVRGRLFFAICMNLLFPADLKNTPCVLQ